MAVNQQDCAHLATLAGLVCVLACGPRPAAAPPPAQRLDTAGWTLTFRLSGGFAGFARSLEVSADGGATAVDDRRQRRVTSRVADPDLAALASLVAGAKSVASRSPSCRDCLEYHVEIVASGRSVVIDVDDASPALAEVKALIDALMRVQDRLLQQPPAPI